MLTLFATLRKQLRRMHRYKKVDIKIKNIKTITISPEDHLVPCLDCKTRMFCAMREAKLRPNSRLSGRREKKDSHVTLSANTFLSFIINIILLFMVVNTWKFDYFVGEKLIPFMFITFKVSYDVTLLQFDSIFKIKNKTWLPYFIQPAAQTEKIKWNRKTLLSWTFQLYCLDENVFINICRRTHECIRRRMMNLSGYS